MNTLPSTVLLLTDTHDAPLGCVRLAPRADDDSKGDCIFDIAEPSEDSADEVRWMYKRHFSHAGEHSFKMSPTGSITLSQGDFRVTFDEREQGGLQSRPPAPVVLASWAPSQD